MLQAPDFCKNHLPQLRYPPSIDTAYFVKLGNIGKGLLQCCFIAVTITEVNFVHDNYHWAASG